MFDLVIAYVVILLVMSTITTALLQLVQRVLPLRSWWLRRQLVKLRMRLTDDAASAADASARELLETVEVNPLRLRWPDHIDGEAVRRWLRKETPESKAAESEGTESPDAESSDAKPSDAKHHRLLDDDGAYDGWWRTIEAQMSASFRLVVVTLSIPLGLALSATMGLDALSVAQHLSESPAEVEALIEDADRDGGSTRRASEEDVLVQMVERQLHSAELDRTERAEILVCVDAFVSSSDASSDAARGAALELAIERAAKPDGEVPEACPLQSGDIPVLLPYVREARDVIDAGLGFGGYPLSENPLLRWLGYLIMAVLIAVGAPFWFELLSLLRLPLSSTPRSAVRGDRD